MYAVIAVTYCDTPDNGRFSATINTLQWLLHTVDRPHEIWAIDNGSSDKRTQHWIKDNDPDLYYVEIPEPMSIAQGVNTAWRHRESDLDAGKAIAIKFDSDMVVRPNDWLDHLLQHAQNPKLGLLGPRMERLSYDGPDMGGWMDVKFVHGACSMRTIAGWRAIGYARNPYGRWGNQDHWDAWRILHAGLHVGIVPDVELVGIFGSSVLPRPEKKRLRNHIHTALEELKRGVKSGTREIREDFDGYEPTS